MADGTDFPVEYEPRLVEEAVLLAMRDHAEGDFRARRECLYEIADAEARDAAFRRFHGAWFERLGLGRGIDQALWERPSIGVAVRTCLVACASSDRQEGAELFVRPAGEVGSDADRRSVVIRLQPSMLLKPARLAEFLRHELLHIADMVDPRFGYEPRLPPSERGPAHEGLLRDRYRAVWDTYVDGRLARLGWAPAGIRAARLGEFTRAFPMLGEGPGAVFERFFSAATLRHADLLAFAVEPESVLDCSSGGRPPGARCSLCRFPTHAFEPAPDRLPSAVQQQIRNDFPEWNPAGGLCLQCADLYRARTAPTLPRGYPAGS